VLDVPAEDVTDTDVLQVQAFGQELGLGPLPAALDPMMMYLRIPHLPRAGECLEGASVSTQALVSVTPIRSR
jgi:hypothetical protein